MDEITERAVERARFPWAVVLIVLLAAGAGVWYLARGGDAPKFRFYMPDGYVFYETTDATSQFRMATGMTSGRSFVPGKQTSRLHVRREFRVHRTRAGYEISSRALSAKAIVNGKPDPIYTAMCSSAITYRLDKHGKLDGVSLQPASIDRIRSALIRRGSAGSWGNQLRNYVISEAKRAWNRRIGGLVGQRAGVGDSWRDSENIPLFGVRGTEMQTFSQVIANEERFGRHCVRIAYAWQPDEEQLRRALVSSRYHGGTRPTIERLDVGLDGEMVVDPDGLRVYSIESHSKFNYLVKTQYDKEGYDSESKSKSVFTYPKERAPKRPASRVK